MCEGKVDATILVARGRLTFTKWEFGLGARCWRSEIGQRHANQSNRFRERKNRSDQFEGKFMKLRPRFNRCLYRSAARGYLEVSPFDLHCNGPAKTIRLLAPGPNIVGHRDHTRFDPSGIKQILREGCLRPRRFSLSVGLNRTIVSATRDFKVPMARFAEPRLQEGQGLTLANPRLSQCQARASWPRSSDPRRGTFRSEAQPRRPRLRRA